MKTIAFVTAHYGLDYLRESVRSIIDAVDAVWFMYSPTPTFGFGTTAQNPDHAADMFAAAKEACASKFHWYTASPNQWQSEGQHHDYIFTLVPDADAYIRLDVDELYGDGLLASALDYMRREDVSALRFPMTHYWRSFYKAVTNDPAYPIRIHRPNAANKRDVTYRDAGSIQHMGYAQRSEVVEYKQHISAHRNEWRADWLETKWRTNAQEDVHPVISNGWWNPKTVDPFSEGMPSFMSEHPYAKMEFIP